LIPTAGVYSSQGMRDWCEGVLPLLTQAENVIAAEGK
jgi:hypothetical protein